MILPIFGVLYGFAIGTFISISPGLGTMQGIWACYLLGDDSLVWGISSVWITTSILGCAKESYTPQLSGNVSSLIGSEIELLEIDPESFMWALYTRKVTIALLALPLGILLYFTFSGSLMYSLIVLGVLLVTIEELRNNKKEVIGYIAFMAVLINLLKVFNVSHIVYALGMGLFFIPGCMNAKIRTAGKQIKVQGTGLEVLKGFVLSIFAPGISPSFFPSIASKQNGVSKELNIVCADFLLEMVSLILLTQGLTNGKSLIGIELPVGIPFPIVLVVFGLIGICGALLPYIQKIYYSTITQDWKTTKFLVLGLGTVVIVGQTGILSPILIGVGLGISEMVKKGYLPNLVYSLTFLGALF